MPSSEQLRAASGSIPNPFGSNSGGGPWRDYTTEEEESLQRRLEKQLGPEFITTRQGAGGQKLPYLAGDKAVYLANDIFGFNGWSSEVRQCQVDFVEECKNSGKVSLGMSVTMRVILKDGTFHEDIGYGSIENARGKAMAFEKVKKEAATDGLKRALRVFGNALGNCVYNKEYTDKVLKVKVERPQWDVNNLHRHPDFVPRKPEEPKQVRQQGATVIAKQEIAAAAPKMASGPSLDDEDEFGMNMFDEVDFNMESHATPPRVIESATSRSIVTGANVPKAAAQMVQGHQNGAQVGRPPVAAAPHNRVEQQPVKHPQRAAGANGVQQTRRTTPPPPVAPPVTRSQGNPPQDNGKPQAHETPRLSNATAASPNVGFVTSRAAEALLRSGGNNPLAAVRNLPAFNPQAESPSIRRTSGINHNVSAPISRDGTTAATSGSKPAGQANPTKTNFANPMVDPARRIGEPGGGGGGGAGGVGGLGNRGAYKPPQMVSKRENMSPVRPPLGDVSNLNGESRGADVSADWKKRQRVGEA